MPGRCANTFQMLIAFLKYCIDFVVCLASYRSNGLFLSKQTFRSPSKCISVFILFILLMKRKSLVANKVIHTKLSTTPYDDMQIAYGIDNSVTYINQ